MKNEIEIYSGKRGIEIKVKFKNETIWLTRQQLAEIFDVDRSVISRHIRNIYETGELDRKSTCAKNAHMVEKRKDRSYETEIFNLDVIISVGYRVNSKKATDFRIWATEKLRNYLQSGYVLDRKKLSAAKDKFEEIKNTLLLIEEKSKFSELTGHEKELLDIIGEYAKTFDLLEKFDEGKLELGRVNKYLKFNLEYEDCLRVIESLRQNLVKKKIATELFGQSVGEKIIGVIRLINQTFDGVDLYPSIEEKAANLLYFVIKDHPFLDGNKRIGSILFLYFLERNGYLWKSNGERKINDNALAALSLLVAVSDPKDKENLVKLVINLIRS
ncbi:MAG: virulence protein RhuM/Fic/DOC family protein [Candidatus Berkelbacteria bacterium]|nr:virulence protein RhuM/Fic/DOC family protein [Candidatus Berkelbacteria bacterium]